MKMHELNNLFYSIYILTSILAINIQCQDAISILGVEITYTYGPATTDFVLKFQLPNTYTQSDTWLAVGFNEKRGMDGGSVMVCTQSGVQHYYNQVFLPVLIDDRNPSLGLSKSSVKFEQNSIICTFTRDNSNGNARYYDIIKNSPYIIVAYGKLSSGTLTKHESATSSSNRYTLNAVLPNTTQGTTTSGSPFTGIAYGIYTKLPFTLKWTAIQDKIDFTLTADVGGSSNVYVAIGFSNDQSMGDDGVVYCTNTGNGNFVSNGYNSGQSKPIWESDSAIGLSNMVVSLQNSNLICSFSRINKLNVKNYFDLNNDYYILFATGSASGNNIEYHTKRDYSSMKIDFQKNNTFVEEPSNNDKLKAHGALMVISWIFCASTGILFARYYKFIFPTVKWFNLQFWFNVHRPLMITVPFLSIIAFIVILADLKWKWVETSSSVGFAHSIFGIVAIGLSLIQIPMALIRPAPTAPRRYIFNYAHRSVGLSAFFLSIIALFLGVCVPRAGIGKNGWGIMIGWLLWVIILPAAIELIQHFFIKKKDNSIPMSPDTTIPNRSLKKFEIIKSIFLVLHLLIALAFTVALIVVIAMGGKTYKS